MAQFLAIDTATTHASVAVFSDEGIVAQGDKEVTTHSEGLIALVDEVLANGSITIDQIDAIVCGAGPGSFTGLRIGMATAKGICFATNKPLITVPSFVALAESVVRAHGDGQITLAMIDARKDEIFWQAYRGLTQLNSPQVSRPEKVEWPSSETPVLLAGSGALRYEAVLRQVLPGATLADPSCQSIQAGFFAPSARQAFFRQEFASLAQSTPLYLRPPDIRPPSTGKVPKMQGSGAKSTLTAEMLEAFRKTGLRLDQEGRWWHEQKLVTHRGLQRALHRWLNRLDDGRFVVQLDDSRYAYVDIDDAPYVIRAADFDATEDGAERIIVRLSDDSSEILEAATLCINSDNILYCRVKAQRFRARFSRSAYYRLAERIEQEDGRFFLVLGTKRWPIVTEGETV